MRSPRPHAPRESRCSRRRYDRICCRRFDPRLVRRWRWTAETDPDKIETAVGGLFPKSEWTMLSHHVIFHGRRICHARKPACGACPIAPLCPAYGEGETDPGKAEKLLKYEKGGFPGQRLNPPQSYLDAGGRPAPPLGAG